MAKRHIIEGLPGEHEELEALVRRGKAAAERGSSRARALLLSDQGEGGPRWIDADIAEALGIITRCVQMLRKRAVEDGPLTAIERKAQARPSVARKFDGEAEARRAGEKLERVHTPRHGSWLNVAEIELSVLSRQCLNRRIADLETLAEEAEAWQQRRIADTTGVDWRFTTDDARIKLKHLYPKGQR